MAVNKKVDVIAQELTDRLKVRKSIKALAIAQSFGTSGDPLIKIGAGTNGGKNAIIRIVNVDWPLAKDVLDLAAGKYGPNKIQIAVEANPAAGAGADILPRQELVDILGECFARGCDIEVYESTAGTAPTESTIATANLKATYDASSYYAFSGQ